MNSKGKDEEKINRKFDVVVPIIERDIHSIKVLIEYWNKFLPVKRFIFIGNKGCFPLLEKYLQSGFEFIDEDTIIPYRCVKKIIKEYTNNNEAAVNRTGWYLQQFLKMSYARLCQDDFYLIWDSDTVPLRKVQMFIDGNPVFDMKTEMCKAYFDTIARLFEGFHRVQEGSFISEHMLINCEVMRTLIDEIEKNQRLIGEKWYEKIIRTIDKEEISTSGFSEFETYGTYCTLRYPETYQFRKWKSCREGSVFFDPSHFTEEEANWVAKEYDAISFEKTKSQNKRYHWFENKILHRIVSYSNLKKIVYLAEIIMG